MSDPLLSQSYAGRAQYQPDREIGNERLLVSVACRVESLPFLTDALLDTGAQWSVLPPEIARQLGHDLATFETPAVMATRFGQLQGGLERYRITFRPDYGSPVAVEATCFVSADWPRPMVLGWKTCLESIRFALDPTHDQLYFAEQ